MSKLTFKKSDSSEKTPDPESEGRIKVIIADDEEEVHAVTRFVLKDFRYQGKGIEFLSAYSGAEAKQLLQEHPDASLILLDIVMEQDTSGLEVTEFIRKELDNELIRIIVRTGQPGTVPEEEVIAKYDVNDYKEKTELTSKKFRTAMTMALRSHADLITLNSFRTILEHEVQVRTAELQEKNRELERLNKELEYYASRDALTGAYNRMKFDTTLESEIKRCSRYSRAMTLAMLDIDHFKRINDTHGHAVGDSALRQFVKLISGQIRECDILARWGGEEFMLLFLESTLEETHLAAEKLRQKIESHSFETIGNLTCSLGITQLLPDDSMQSLNRRADEALYQAKKDGRNRVVCK
jgi:diguanylate cyclase (GGDEF)-like protein